MWKSVVNLYSQIQKPVEGQVLVVSLEWISAVTETTNSYYSAMKVEFTITADTSVSVCAASLQITQ